MKTRPMERAVRGGNGLAFMHQRFGRIPEEHCRDCVFFQRQIVTEHYRASTSLTCSLYEQLAERSRPFPEYGQACGRYQGKSEEAEW